MEFDKSRVYTALNADELKVGSKVIVADSLQGLKDRVNKAASDDEYISRSVCILPETRPYRAGDIPLPISFALPFSRLKSVNTNRFPTQKPHTG